MHALQYGVVLPADYDMQIMRDIVARNGHLLDERRGLGFKAYLLRERSVAGSPVNYYGSFYLWNDASAMAHFLVGGGAFERIIRGLGRLAVAQWLGLSCVAGAARTSAPRFATSRITCLSSDLDRQADGLGMAAFIEEECGRLEEFRNHPHVHTAALALDAQSWRMIRFVAWSTPSHPEEAAERYEILHVSTPDIAALPNGRVW